VRSKVSDIWYSHGSIHTGKASIFQNLSSHMPILTRLSFPFLTA